MLSWFQAYSRVIQIYIYVCVCVCVCVCMYILFRFFSIIGDYKLLTIASYAVCFSVLYIVVYIC